MKKRAITSSHNIINNFLSENKKYQINNTRQSICNLDDEISDNDEVWIVQCPKSIDVQQLHEVKVKLPGKSNCNSVETLAEEFSTPKEICLGYKNDDEFKIKQLPVRGNILIREKLKVIKTEETNIEDDNITYVRTPFPCNLKVRHPLHGHKYEDRIHLNENVRERLKKSDEIIKKSKKIKRSTEDDEFEMMRTRKHRSSEKTSQKKNYKLKVENDEDISIDLAWIKNI